MRVSLPAVDERLAGSIRVHVALGVLPRIQRQLALRDHDNDRTRMTVPASLTSRRQDNLLDDRLLCIRDVNNLLTAVTNFDLDIDLLGDYPWRIPSRSEHHWLASP